MGMIGKTIEQLNMGDVAEFSKTVGESDVYIYAGITGDFNPVHINEAYASQTFFKTRIAHGMLIGGGCFYRHRNPFARPRDDLHPTGT